MLTAHFRKDQMPGNRATAAQAFFNSYATRLSNEEWALSKEYVCHSAHPKLGLQKLVGKLRNYGEESAGNPHLSKIHERAL